ncbi:MAG: hypothetical protein A7315_02270 [Candidatus Altiarchaeales archaeon WOR_SM1_79]|nr:MAG: hypothetical protein A7315_02270 [Candidatus Altiarchaeales archaeon WOR_SM1_79]
MVNKRIIPVFFTLFTLCVILGIFNINVVSEEAYKNFREGDILYHNSNWIRMESGHVGIIVKDNNGNLVVRESLKKGDTGNIGVVDTSLDDFYKRYKSGDIKHLRVNVDDETSKKAADYAKTIEGKYSLTPWADKKWYCSELVSTAYKKGANINLGSIFKLWITPDDIYKNKKTYDVADKKEDNEYKKKDDEYYVEYHQKFPLPPDDPGGGAANIGGGDDDSSLPPSEYSIIPGGINFSSIQLNYISTYSDPTVEAYNFSFIVKAKIARENDESIDLENTAQQPLNAFLVGITLPDDIFWVNLNPGEPDRIIDENLEKTDIGRIMLEADLRMKKDFGKNENPCANITKDIETIFWEQLDKKESELIKKSMWGACNREIDNPENVRFHSVSRHWIIPHDVTAYGNDNEIYIVNATLSILSEPVYNYSLVEIINQDISSISKKCLNDLDDAAKEYGRFATELEDKLILPKVNYSVNYDSSYSDLRRVYVSLALAQWYKEHDREGMFSDMKDTKNLNGLESQNAWDSMDIWRKYNDSFYKGDYHCWKNTTSETRSGNKIITSIQSRYYTGGGVDFKNIKIDVIDDIKPELRKKISDSIHGHGEFTEQEGEYFFGDVSSIYSRTSEPPEPPEHPEYPEPPENGHPPENNTEDTGGETSSSDITINKNINHVGDTTEDTKNTDGDTSHKKGKIIVILLVIVGSIVGVIMLMLYKGQV